MMIITGNVRSAGDLDRLDCGHLRQISRNGRPWQRRPRLLVAPLGNRHAWPCFISKFTPGDHHLRTASRNSDWACRPNARSAHPILGCATQARCDVRKSCIRSSLFVFRTGLWRGRLGTRDWCFRSPIKSRCRRGRISLRSVSLQGNPTACCSRGN